MANDDMLKVIYIILTEIFSNLSEIKITLKGVEYLKENSTMKRVHNAFYDVKDIVPCF